MGFIEDQQQKAKDFNNPGSTSPNLDNSDYVIQSELEAEEKLLWSGKPNVRKALSKNTLKIIAIGLFFILFETIFISMFVTQMPSMMTSDAPASVKLFMLLFILAFFFPIILMVVTCKKGYAGANSTFYGVTDRRIIILKNQGIKQIKSYVFGNIPFLEKSVGTDGYGTIKFGNDPTNFNMTNQMSMFSYIFDFNLIDYPALKEVEHTDQVYNIISSQMKLHRN